MQKIRLIGWLLIGATAILPGHGQSHAAPRANVELLYADIVTRPAGAGAPQPVLALVQGEPTAVNGYPGPTGTPAATEAYPAVQPSPLPADTVTPYPAGTAGDESSPTPIPIIGDETEAATAFQAADNGQPINSRQALRGRLFLWGGFIVALLLFVTGVAGSIVLFMRRRG